MPEFEAKPNDLRWGDYHVTSSQQLACEALEPVFRGGKDFFCRQKPSGTIVMGFGGKSIDITRSGRVFPNHSTGRIEYV